MKKIRMTAALCAVFLMAFSFSTVVYASGGEETPEVTEAPATSETTSDPQSLYPRRNGNCSQYRHGRGRQAVLYHYHPG